MDIAEAFRVAEDEVDLLCLDSAASDTVLEALDGEAIYVEDPYLIFELRLKALMELLDLQVGLEHCSFSVKKP